MSRKANPFNHFTTALAETPNRNVFDLSHQHKTTFQMGMLVPTLCMEVMPGDSFNIKPEHFMRLTPQLAPVMHNVKVINEVFFVPNRILWEDWEDFITGKDPSLIPPYITNQGTFGEGKLHDYFGITPNLDSTIEISAFPFAAYEKIYIDWFRNQFLQDDEYEELIPGDNSTHYGQDVAANFPRFRNWRADYFTATLPYAQIGDPVALPLVDDSEVPVTLKQDYVADGDEQQLRLLASGNLPSVTQPNAVRVDPGGNLEIQASNQAVVLDPNGTLVVNINDNAVSINELRKAFRLKEFLELDALGGQRYIEVIRSHFGITSKDARHQRPEVIGRSFGNISFSTVFQTAQDSDEPLAQMAGAGVAVVNSDNMSYFAEEHGWIIGLTSVVPDATYEQGVSRHWTRKERTDWPWPKFAHIGEQEVLNKEIYAEAGGTGFDDTFGYLPRYSEMRFEHSRVSGEFRSSRDYWTFGRKFDSQPALNSGFVRIEPIYRPFAVQDPVNQPDHVLAHCYYHVTVSRLLPLYGRPRI